MAIVRDFIYSTDDNLGLDGLRPAWFENADPTNGRGVAHDMLEHFKHQVGPIEGELEALGSAMALRWEHEPSSTSSAEEIMARDICTVICDMAQSGHRVPAPKNSKKLSDCFSYADDAIVSGVKQGMEDARKELLHDEPDDDFLKLLTVELQTTMIAWIRQGYRKAVKRYDGVDLYTLGTHFFKKVTTKIDSLLSSENLHLGDRVRVSLYPQSDRVAISVNGYCAYDFGYI